MQLLEQAIAPPEPELGEDVREIAYAWSTLARRANLPRVHDHIAHEAGVALDRASFWLLRLLGEADRLRLSDIAHRQGMDASTACRQIRHCEDTGLVQRQADPSDQRAVLFTLTDKGRDSLQRMQAVRLAMVASVLTDWSEEDRHAFARLTRRFADTYLSDLGATV